MPLFKGFKVSMLKIYNFKGFQNFLRGTRSTNLSMVYTALIGKIGRKRWVVAFSVVSGLRQRIRIGALNAE